MNVDHEKLEFLRNNTVLTPAAKAKVIMARRQAEYVSKMYTKLNPQEKIGVDYSVADELEYNFRFLSLERKLEKNWKKYILLEQDGYGLEDFTNDYINNHIEKKQSKSL